MRMIIVPIPRATIMPKVTGGTRADSESHNYAKSDRRHLSEGNRIAGLTFRVAKKPGGRRRMAKWLRSHEDGGEAESPDIGLACNATAPNSLEEERLGGRAEPSG